ncbi:MAG: glycosyltransferase family 4 protein, partial [Parachlamydiaceae bacterium]|nr:glycosyltransferase family 4 protein [Parachlamydiaceae bacterium]
MQIFLFIFFALFTFAPLCAEQAEQPESVVIVTYKVAGAAPWDPDSIKSGITGSEEAVIYMSQHLAEEGYKVTVLGDPPAQSPHSSPKSNPRYVDFNFTDGTIYDIAIAWRMPWSAESIKKYARTVYLWPHDTFDSRLSPKEIHGFDGVLWLSQWQRDYWISKNPEFARFKTIFGNGINPEQFQPLQNRENPYSCIYGSNYSRGLEVLLDLWPKIKHQYPKATLDIYYGWQHWGLLTKDKELKMRHQISLFKPLGVNEHGLVSHEELNRAYEKSSFWAYPCTYPEVFCITALRAQLAGAVPVIIDGAALPETVPSGYKCANSTEYFDTLCKAFSEAEKITLEDRDSMGDFILDEYTWDSV